ncbi:hypothetical protein QFZ22_006168 [Streptomyces canus]|uniref:Uncharacterized protein n=1 Tax=Streptomyces canus TaxID=58343 RepID=A0AAW8FJX6_9ACTN|nr:hypothetical protein [Streptomyces canus]MDQ0910183.1 hypothetical protein [Streptomyces canus]
MVLALARVVKNLPSNAINRFFEHRTSKYQIIASDSKGRVAVMQKQRLVFFGFVFMCVLVGVLFFIDSTRSETRDPAHHSAPTATSGARVVP